MAATRTPSCSGVRALVTGGTSGLGRAMAEALAAAGAQVVLTGRDPDRTADAAAAVGAVGVAFDVTDDAAVADGVGRARDALGGLDLLVNNAGIGMRAVNPRFLSDPQPFWQVDPDGFRAVVATNLTGAFLVARQVVPRMLASGGGQVVNVSMNHATMVRRGFVPYGPSRAGAESLSRVMAADLADSPVRVNLLLPGGATRTGMIPDGALSAEQMAGLLDPSVMGPPLLWLATAGVHDRRVVADDPTTWGEP